MEGTNFLSSKNGFGRIWQFFGAEQLVTIIAKLLNRPLACISVCVLLLSACGGGANDADNTTTGSNELLTPAPTVSLSANPVSITSGASSTLTWSSTNATSCAASGAWSGSKSTSGSQSTGTLTANSTFSLSCSGAGGSTSKSVSVTVNAPSPAPTVSLSANPTSVTSGDAAMLTWSSTNATSCIASGDWSGSKPTSGSASTGGLTAATSTFTLSCTGPGGTTSQLATVTASTAGSIYGLNFPGSSGVANTMRFRFLNPLAIYPATYIWRAYPRRQAGYFTAFFWGNDDGQGTLSTFLWTRNGGADSYYGAHPYPNAPPNGTSHSWEISIEQQDFVNGAVVYDRWYTQALRVWSDASGKHHEFYWDLPNTDASHRVTRTSPTSWGNVNPPVPALTWGDAPWNPGNEVWSGVLRGIQIYSANLSVADILSEASAPLSTTAGAANVWYLNLNPTPTDISDKSGAGHQPAWVGNLRPSLWTQ